MLVKDLSWTSCYLTFSVSVRETLSFSMGINQLGDLQAEHTSKRVSACTREELGRYAQKVMSSYNQLSGLIPSKIFSLQTDKYPSSDMKAGSLAAHKEEG